LSPAISPRETVLNPAFQNRFCRLFAKRFRQVLYAGTKFQAFPKGRPVHCDFLFNPFHFLRGKFRGLSEIALHTVKKNLASFGKK